ncbi:YoaK family protein [Sphingomonas paucimobilis]|uniref:YoaK family protein n=1 Tax=Sphingomonas paucimobilis TaxID=13689 RepID=UPI0028D39117|nr:YoaK family protein [Sphingomonas paucimobilis]
MIRSDRRSWPLAIGLSLLAGYVDAIGFQRLGGYFVSFMSGNGTMLALGLVAPGGAAHGVAILAALLALFVVGVMLGTLIRLILPRAGQPGVLVLVAMLLAGAAAVQGWAGLLMAVAMGAANATFERDGEVSIGVTYMTGTLVKIGQHLARMVAGRTRWAWVPYLLLWIGFVAGASLGAVSYAQWGVAALWGAVMAALAAAAAAWTLSRAA